MLCEAVFERRRRRKRGGIPIERRAQCAREVKRAGAECAARRIAGAGVEVLAGESDERAVARRQQGLGADDANRAALRPRLR